MGKLNPKLVSGLTEAKDIVKGLVIFNSTMAKRYRYLMAS